MNMNEVIEQEQLERDRKKLVNKGKDINDIKWEFIERSLTHSRDFSHVRFTKLL